MRPHRLFRIHVHRRHEPPRLIGADRQEGEIAAPEPFPDLGEMRSVTAVAAEINRAAAGEAEREPGPQRTAAIPGRAGGEMLGGRADQLEFRSDPERLPPI